MRIGRMSLAAILATAPAAAAAMLGTASASAAPGVEGCVDVVGVSACTSVDIGVPNINAVENIPYVPVPNINLPKVKVNPGHVGAPGRGR
ncbi:hypothetical protein [Mycobacterium marinum]|uniref:hypothetical protein n=1 Tax=Mycobacterium marinum TaxID=1781 RepID=UPI0003588278|nr:hypothetical protein [Mycobacterium marinum]EPQ76322.1 putative secreted protein [Mycobacterium marinum MB2]GJO14835.1 hypothetical protein NJB1507_00380 [Mycobacterium marinum]